MKNNRPKYPRSEGNKKHGINRKASKTPQNGGALNLQKPSAPSTVDIAKIIIPSGKMADRSRALPELLAPAGSMDSLRAAIAGGADAVYFGGGDFNARINAKNFTNEEIKQAIDLLHSCGRRAYITLNTLVHGRELEDYLRFAEFVHKSGADALIVADIGGAEAIHRHLPDLELHASTQMSGHNLAQAELLSKLGFSRMVVARETPREDIEYLVKNSPIEIEMFTHGALCVCHSGQCLFSSLVGGRSGNRGACAQPCRLPYRDADSGESYPLSLKDLTLAHKLDELCACGVHSLKIEGRMKSPEYVFGVVRAFRTLLDEGRSATEAELADLAKIFSRGGFTDAYYERRIDSSMLGIRSDEQKLLSRLALTSSERLDEIKPQKLAVSMSARLKLGKPAELTLACADRSVTAYGAVPETATNAPLSAENIKKNLTKLGATRFELDEYTCEADENIILPVSALNSLRREACTMLDLALSEANDQHERVGFEKYIPRAPKNEKIKHTSARFYSAAQITEGAREYFDTIYLPLEKYDTIADGVILPPVIFDSERARVEKMLAAARDKGAKCALVGNLGALELVKKYGFEIHGDFRFNVYNSETVAALENLGVSPIILSPELTLPQIRDAMGNTAAIVYGRIPLMLLEKCVNSEISTCKSCTQNGAILTDRRGIGFPTLREWEHRNTVYNSAPTYMADKQAELDRAGILNRHFIFSTETAAEVDQTIHLYRTCSPAPDGEKIRRI